MYTRQIKYQVVDRVVSNKLRTFELSYSTVTHRKVISICCHWCKLQYLAGQQWCVGSLYFKLQIAILHIRSLESWEGRQAKTGLNNAHATFTCIYDCCLTLYNRKSGSEQPLCALATSNNSQPSAATCITRFSGLIKTQGNNRCDHARTVRNCSVLSSSLSSLIRFRVGRTLLHGPHHSEYTSSTASKPRTD